MALATFGRKRRLQLSFILFFLDVFLWGEFGFSSSTSYWGTLDSFRQLRLSSMRLRQMRGCLKPGRKLISWDNIGKVRTCASSWTLSDFFHATILHFSTGCVLPVTSSQLAGLYPVVQRLSQPWWQQSGGCDVDSERDPRGEVFSNDSEFFVGSHQEPVITIRCTACGHLWREDEVRSATVTAPGGWWQWLKSCTSGWFVQAIDVFDIPVQDFRHQQYYL